MNSTRPAATQWPNFRLPFLLVCVACLGCGRPNRDAELDAMAQYHCGTYRAKWHELSSPRIRLSADHTFHFAEFPAEWLPALALERETELAGEGTWRVASDDGSLVALLDIKTVNGRAAGHSLLWRYGSTALLISPPNDKIAEFVLAN